MRIIVPLAGPDFELADGSTRAERVVEGLPLLRLALESRSWWRSGAVGSAVLVFVMRDTPVSRRFAAGPLAEWYPDAATVFLSRGTSGAALTILAGLALCDAAAPLCIDLADIVFDEEIDPIARLVVEHSAGLLLTFPSSDPVYSYAVLDDGGAVVETAEKRVISGHASAGVYFFRDVPTLLYAVGHSMLHRGDLSYRDLLYVCPLYNGVIAGGGRVVAAPVKNVRDIKVLG